jgi:hypothetical protein
MARYLLAITLPSSVETALRDSYLQVFGKPLPVRTLHCTFIPPFVLKKGQTLVSLKALLKDTPPLIEQFSFGAPGLFVLKSRKIAYVQVLPSEPLQKIYDSIIEATKPIVDIETKAFKDNKLPAYLPHVTLNYNFRGDIAQFVPPSTTFPIPSPQLLTETGPGFWRAEVSQPKYSQPFIH